MIAAIHCEEGSSFEADHGSAMEMLEQSHRLAAVIGCVTAYAHLWGCRSITNTGDSERPKTYTALNPYNTHRDFPSLPLQVLAANVLVCC